MTFRSGDNLCVWKNNIYKVELFADSTSQNTQKTEIPRFHIINTDRGAGQLTRNKVRHLTQTVV
jgi:hypothetical protein